MAPPRIDGATQVYEAAPTTSFVIPRPTAGGALQLNDLLIAVIAFDTADANSLSRTLPSGWTSFQGATVLSGSGSTTLRSEVYYHFVTSAEVASPPSGWTVTIGTAMDGSISVDRYRGVDTSNPFAVTGNYGQTNHTSAVASKVAPSVTTLIDDTTLVTAATHRSGSQALTAGSPTTGYTRSAAAWGVGGRSSGLAYKTQATAGASGTATWTQSTGTGVGIGFQTALRPAPAVSGDIVQRYTGSAWVNEESLRYTGSAWVAEVTDRL